MEDAAQQAQGFLDNLRFSGKDKDSLFNDISLFSELDETSAAKLLNILKEQQTLADSGAKSWQNYFSDLKKGQEWQIKFVQNNDLQKASTDDLIKASKAAREAAIAHNNSLKQLTLGAKAASVGLKALSMAGNMAVFALVSKGIELAASAVSSWMHRVENANAAMKDAVSEYSASKSELDEISAELTKQNEKIEELQAKGKLTYLEKGQLAELKETTKELLIQQDIASKRADAESKEAAKSAVDAFETQYGRYDLSKEDLEETFTESETTGMFPHPQNENDITGNIAALTRSKELLEEERQKYLDAIANGEDTAPFNDSIENYENMVALYSGNLNNSIFDLEEKRLALSDEYEKAVTKRDTGSETMTTSDNKLISSYEAIANTIRLIYEYTDKDAWNAMQIDDIFNTDGLEKTEEELIEMAAAGTLTPETIESYANLNKALNDSELLFDENTTAAAALYDEICARAKSLEGLEAAPPSFEELTKDAQTAAGNISALHSSLTAVNDAFAQQAENGSVSADTMLALVNAGYSSALQFDAVTGACTLNRDAMLELIRTKTENQIKDLEFLQTNIQEKLLNDGIAASEASNGFIDLAKAKAASANQELTTDQVNAIGDYNEAEAQLKSLKDSLKEIDKIGSGSSPAAKKPSAAKSSGAKPAAADPVKEKFQREYDALKHNLDMKYITEEDYYHSVDSLNQKYFAGKEKYLSDYRKYEEEVSSGLQKYYKSCLENQTSWLDTALDSGKISYQEYSAKVTALLSEMYQSGKISAEDYFSYQQKMLEKQLSVYQSALSAVTALLEKETDKYQSLIDGVEKQNDALEEQLDNYDRILSVADDVYQTEIDRLKEEQDNIQNKIDSLNEEADAYDYIKRKEEALYALRRAEEQRVNKVFIEGRGFVYTKDEAAVREAGENLKAVEDEDLIRKLEQEKESLNGSIELLEHYRGLWAEISETKEQETNRQLAIDMFGENYEQFILQNRTADIEAFKENYLQIQAEIDDNTSLIESYNEKIEYYNQLKEQWQSISDAYQTSVDTQNAAQLLGADWEAQVLSGRLDTLNSFKNQYISLQQAIADTAWASANAQIEAAQAAQKAAEGTVGSAETVGNTDASGSKIQTGSAEKKAVSGGIKPTITKISDSKGGTYHVAYKDKNNVPHTSTLSKYGAGTKNAAPGYHLVAEGGDEIIRDNYGNAFLAQGKQLYPFEGGETVFSSSETRELLQNSDNQIPLQIGNFHSNDMKIFEEIQKISSPTLHMDMPDYSYLNPNRMQMASHSVVQNINVTLPNITNEAGFNRFKKEMERFRLDAYQYSRRRH